MPPHVPELVSTVTIGTLPEHFQSLALGINQGGAVVGFSLGGEGVVRAFYWTEAAGMRDLGDGVANDVSDFGVVVGQFEGRAILWDPVVSGWNRVELPPFEDPVRSGTYNDFARGIDPVGQFVAGSSSPDLGRRPDGGPRIGWIPVLWRRGATGWNVVSLPTADGTGPGAGTGIAMDVNSAGVAVGVSPSPPPLPNRAVIWRPGVSGYSMELLPPSSAHESWAGSIGEDGRIAGFLGESNGARIGVTWTPTASGWRVDSLGPDEAHDINGIGLVVGEVSEVGGAQAAWMWTAAGGRRSLGPGAALGVNGRNEVIGDGGDFVAVMWKLSRP